MLQLTQKTPKSSELEAHPTPGTSESANSEQHISPMAFITSLFEKYKIQRTLALPVITPELCQSGPSASTVSNPQKRKKKLQSNLDPNHENTDDLDVSA